MPDLGLPHVHSGKVREIYALGDDWLLMVTSDRISAFDVVMNEPIPDKGRVLTAMSAFWFDQLADVVPGHLLSTDVSDLPDEVRASAERHVRLSPIVRDLVPEHRPTSEALRQHSTGTRDRVDLSAERPKAVVAVDDLAGRIMITRRAQMLPIECIVRGYLSGSAWKEYLATGTMHGAALPDGLLESAPLPEPVFTPSTKADEGHDENISFEEAAELVGAEMAVQVRDVCLELYRRGAAWARERGIIIADTKFELGTVDGQLVLCDEVLTPDSSRFWPVDAYQAGTTPPSFDKQPLRDFLETFDWDKKPPPPPLPPEVVTATSRRYVDAYERITGHAFADWSGATHHPG